MVRRPPVDALAVLAGDGKLTKEVLIQVRNRSATGEDVAIQYEKCLPYHGLSPIAGRGVFAYNAADDSLRMLARPEQETAFHPELRHFVRTKEEQGKFPDPCDVGHFYEMLRAQGYPTGRGGGSPPKLYNLIPACAAWYVGAREALAADTKEQRRPAADVEAMVTKHVLKADTDTVPTKIRSTLKRDVEASAPQIVDPEAKIRESRVFMNTNLADS